MQQQHQQGQEIALQFFQYIYSKLLDATDLFVVAICKLANTQTRKINRMLGLVYSKEKLQSQIIKKVQQILGETRDDLIFSLLRPRSFFHYHLDHDTKLMQDFFKEREKLNRNNDVDTFFTIDSWCDLIHDKLKRKYNKNGKRLAFANYLLSTLRTSLHQQNKPKKDPALILYNPVTTKRPIE